MAFVMFIPRYLIFFEAIIKGIVLVYSFSQFVPCWCIEKLLIFVS
jgi:hypothetical protein